VIKIRDNNWVTLSAPGITSSSNNWLGIGEGKGMGSMDR
jgi:hypothetical protein